MKKVPLMTLNVQQENVLSKDERKAALGGKTVKCYVVCSDGNSLYVGGCYDYDMRTVCFYSGNSTPVGCDCWPPF
jgi:hypothetical protein